MGAGQTPAGDLPGHSGEVYRRFDRLEQEYQAIAQALRRIEGR
ncbi:MAG TPA: hypothetical protein VMT97_05275 [Terriglobales bacterium]|nr:hypothetical protein [Terriglobales bacterium]